MTTTLAPASTESNDVSAGDLRAAIGSGALVLHYQPIVNLATEAVTGFEALVRWAHPELGLLCAARFIPLAESSGLIREVDDWVLRTACHQLAAWQEDVLVTPDFRLSVNVSGLEMDGPGLVGRVAEAVAETGVDPQGLVIEVTETRRIESVHAAQLTAEGLHAIGVELALDDFGIQYASFRRLHALTFDVLKIDRQFVADSDTELGRAFVHALVELGNILGAVIIAEGIETEEQAAQLRMLGCHEGQGFHWAPALPVDQAEHLLAGGDWPARDVKVPWCAYAPQAV